LTTALKIDPRHADDATPTLTLTPQGSKAAKYALKKNAYFRFLIVPPLAA